MRYKCYLKSKRNDITVSSCILRNLFFTMNIFLSASRIETHSYEAFMTVQRVKLFASII